MTLKEYPVGNRKTHRTPSIRKECILHNTQRAIVVLVEPIRK